MKLKLLLKIAFLLFLGQTASAQDVSLYQQHNGRYDFLFFGNTMNLYENTAFDPCLINSQSSAALSLSPDDVIKSAYLYWAGSGTGDFDVELNGEPISAARTFSVIQASTGNAYFSAFADVTTLVQSTGNANYTLSELDIAQFLSPEKYCINGGNFGGWAIVVIYENPALPLNQLNVYDGLQAVPTVLTITLDSLNVIDNDDARIGFIAWEGDRNIAVGESLAINGSPIGNPPLNPVNNAFNGTNSFTGADDLYNMDLDVYNIQNNIAIGDTVAEITLTSGQDFVMINTVVTKLNSQLPDATVSIDNISMTCGSRNIIVDYTIYNTNSTNPLPAGVPIAVYIGDLLIGYTETMLPIDIGESDSDQISLIIPDDIPLTFTLTFAVDDLGTGVGIVTELNEANNQAVQQVSLLVPPAFNVAPDLQACNEGFGFGTFDFSGYSDLIAIEASHQVTFHASQEDAEAGQNEILNTSAYPLQPAPGTIWARIDNGICFSIASFNLLTRNCPPIIYNYVSVNGDGVNDVFFIDGLHNIFLNFKLAIFNRWGKQVWEGDRNSGDWDGRATKGYLIGGDEVPDGTYYYILNLNDPDYPEPFTGFLYLNH